MNRERRVLSAARALRAMAVTCAMMLVAIGAADSGSAAVTAAKKSPIVIGNLSTISGAASQVVGLAPAMNAWAASVNAQGGINGHPVKLIMMDDAGTAANALSDVKQLVEQDHIVAFVGNNDSYVEATYVKYLNQVGVPDIGGWTGGTPFWENQPDFYPVTTTSTAYVAGNAFAAKQAGAKSLGFPYCVESPICLSVEGTIKKAAAAAGLKWAGALGVSASAPSYVAPCLQLKNSGADALVDAMLDPVRFLEACSQQGYSPKLVLSLNGVFLKQFVGSQWDGRIIGVNESFPWTVHNAETAAFFAAMKKYAPGLKLGPDQTQEWTAGLMFQKAASAIKGTITSKSMTTSLRKIKNATLGGLAPAPITYTDPTSHKLNCYWVMKFRNSQWAAAHNLQTSCATL